MRIIECLAIGAILSSTTVATAAASEPRQGCRLPNLPERLDSDPLLCEFDEAWSAQFATEGYREAADLARRYLSQSDLDPEQRAFVLQRLALAQHREREIEAARQNYLLAIELLEGSSDRLDVRLIDPLLGLGQTLLEDEATEEAAYALERAAHISRVAEGPYNVRQGPIIDELVKAHVMNGRFDLALDAQSSQLESYTRAYGHGDDRVIASWLQRGELFSAAGMYNEAQQAYKLAMRTVRQHDGMYSAALLPLLDSMAQSYLNHGMNTRLSRIGIAKQYLERKVIVVNKNPDIDPATRAAVYVQMGNFLQKYSGWEFAIANYRNAWEELGKLSDAEQLRAAYFSEPAILVGEDRVVEAGNVMGSPDGAPLTDYAFEVPVTLDVSNQGEPRNVRFDDDMPLSRSTRERALRLARKLKFRPKIVDSAAVDALNQRYTLTIPVEIDGARIADGTR